MSRRLVLVGRLEPEVTDREGRRARPLTMTVDNTIIRQHRAAVQKGA